MKTLLLIGALLLVSVPAWAGYDAYVSCQAAADNAMPMTGPERKIFFQACLANYKPAPTVEPATRYHSPVIIVEPAPVVVMPYPMQTVRPSPYSPNAYGPNGYYGPSWGQIRDTYEFGVLSPFSHIRSQ